MRACCVRGRGVRSYVAGTFDFTGSIQAAAGARKNIPRPGTVYIQAPGVVEPGLIDIPPGLSLPHLWLPPSQRSVSLLRVGAGATLGLRRSVSFLSLELAAGATLRADSTAEETSLSLVLPDDPSDLVFAPGCAITVTDRDFDLSSDVALSLTNVVVSGTDAATVNAPSLSLSSDASLTSGAALRVSTGALVVEEGSTLGTTGVTTSRLDIDSDGGTVRGIVRGAVMKWVSRGDVLVALSGIVGADGMSLSRRGCPTSNTATEPCGYGSHVVGVYTVPAYGDPFWPTDVGSR